MIASSRDAYDAAVRHYNTSITKLTPALIAGPMGLSARALFGGEPDAVQTPSAKLW